MSIKIENVDVFGFEAAIRGMRSPMNSWEKSDSFYCGIDGDWGNIDIGPNDLDLMKRLSKAGNDHGKFLRMINVTMDLTAPLYFFKEFDTYKVGTVANSCSTMHKIHAKEFTLDDFSHEHLVCDEDLCCCGAECITPKDILEMTICSLNGARQKYIEAKNKPMKEESKRSGLMKKYWWLMIQLLPSSYNQRRTVQLNYQVLKSMYFARRNHKLDEWHTLCDWMLTLPYFREICVEVV